MDSCLDTLNGAQDKLWIDVGFWGGLIPENSNNHSVLEGILTSGALGFKSFMSPSGANFLTVFAVLCSPFLLKQLV